MDKDSQSNNKDALFLDQKLRPERWEEYVGQAHIKQNLEILLRAARERSHPPEHLLFYGPPGLGKTTLAHLIAKETSAQMKSTSGPAIEKVGDLASILSNLNSGDILFIDEIHRLNKMDEEILYPAMESGVLDIIIGKGPSARTIQLELPPFTLIGATTGVALEGAAGKAIASRSRFTPRTANYFLKRARDFAQVGKRRLDVEAVKETLRLLEIDELGLSQPDRQMLTVVIEKFGGGPVGLSTVAAATSEEQATIEEVYEPYLLKLGLLDRTPRGRTATKKAYEHLGFDFPADAQEKLL